MVRGWRGEVSRRAPGDERSSARSSPFSGPGNGPVFLPAAFAANVLRAVVDVSCRVLA
ncbi:hypothetical protein BURMUCF1_1845 [Burkholderia multivorans ATCC BAA-247]|nr:hypothetical protein BURMUCF1_1845 [Burkholderia multivorans ATCC BAA-247]